MNKKITTIFLVTISLPILLYSAKTLVRAYQNYNGFCRAEEKYLTRDELRRRVIETLIDEHEFNSRLLHSKGKQGEKFYKNADDFLQENPNCCHFLLRENDGMRPNLLQRVTGEIFRYVRVTYVMPKKDESEIKIRTSAFAISTCGVQQSYY